MTRHLARQTGGPRFGDIRSEGEDA
jgi:hypothetical protein